MFETDVKYCICTHKYLPYSTMCEQQELLRDLQAELLRGRWESQAHGRGRDP